MGRKNDCFGFRPTDTGICDGNKRVEVFFLGFTVHKGLIARLHIALQHHPADSGIGLDVNPIGVPESLDQHMVEDLTLLAIVLAGIFMRAVHNDGLNQRRMGGQHLARFADADGVVVGPLAAPQDDMAISIAS